MAHETTVKVRFSETDALGHISNISYFIYMEEARTDFFEEIGFGTDIADWKIILVSAKCDFVRQGHFNQRLKVITEISRIGNSSFMMVHQILDEKTGELIAKGEAGAVYFNFETQKGEPLPAKYKGKLERHLVKGATQHGK
ncbi:thioesterase family protein [Planococcus sp. N028]|uniref:Thioesterase family protein n=1 Tax=Planococcus shixiaomingii TaxID=3058393 RepID=A0ABT8N636_9BACL|nr:MULTISPECIES: thioesterase family protein [unclassified Planococcus (in: firmicutes)]MDN7243203.1 thioesterase family protein [Planococcus sp. N028]WKA55146.1 thioesterase family protein [Planococcus sp. N022]